MADVVLTAALRGNLQALQLTQSLIDSTQLRLSTGKRVNSALDSPQNFFAAQSLGNRASDLSRLLDGIGQSIQTVKAADKGVTSVTSLVEQAESLANTAREKAASGEVLAGATGTLNLKGIDDLTTAGITAGDTLTLSVIDDDNDLIRLNDENTTPAAADTYVITFRADGNIAANTAGLEVTSVDQLITAINGIRRNSDGSKVFNASLDSNGQLKVTANEGYSYRAVFNNVRVADSLGIGEYVTFREAANTALASAARVGFTASNKTTLASLKFTDTSTSDVALRNTTLANLRDDTSTARFDGDNAGDNIAVDVLLANGTRKQLSDVLGSAAITTSSVGDVVDGINGNTTINPYIKASFDEETGQFKIEALSADVIGLTIGVVDNAGANAQANFGFGAFANTVGAGATQVDIDPTGGNAQTENIFFAQGAAELASLKTQYVGLLDQIDELVDDSGYAGTNLLDGDTLTTYFNEDRSSSLETVGQSLKFGELGLSKDIDFGTTAAADAIIADVKAALTTVRNFSASLANDLSVIQTREEFTKGLIDTLQEGSDKLTLADQNEEGAKLLSLQTRQQLGVTALSLAAQSQQAILRLF